MSLNDKKINETTVVKTLVKNPKLFQENKKKDKIAQIEDKKEKKENSIEKYKKNKKVKKIKKKMKLPINSIKPVKDDKNFEKLNFKTKLVFGNRFIASIDQSFAKVSKLFFNQKLDPNGLVFLSKLNSVKKEDLWSYIYYLFHYNKHSVSQFKKISAADKRQKASARKFYTMVREELDLDLNTFSIIEPPGLAVFINNIIVQNKPHLINPIIDYMGIYCQKNK